jgi:hypothetical protein
MKNSEIVAIAIVSLAVVCMAVAAHFDYPPDDGEHAPPPYY